MSERDLPLFAWQPPCKVIVFPLVNRIGKIRHTALLLASKDGDDALLYWKQVIAANRKHLARLGLDEDGIESELHSFHDAVQTEMARHAYGRGSNNPKGAA